jgi:hypothetical protein
MTNDGSHLVSQYFGPASTQNGFFLTLPVSINIWPLRKSCTNNKDIAFQKKPSSPALIATVQPELFEKLYR